MDSQLGSTQLSSAQLSSTQLNSTQLNSTQLNSSHPFPPHPTTHFSSSRPRVPRLRAAVGEVKEYVECSNHGYCNRDGPSPSCVCARGWKGVACDDNSDAADHTFLYADGPFFTGSVLRMRSHRSPSSEFDLMRAETGDGSLPYLTLDGVGDMTLHQGSQVRKARVRCAPEGRAAGTFEHCVAGIVTPPRTRTFTTRSDRRRPPLSQSSPYPYPLI